jgi:Fe-S cluster assembly ATP-binding protein
MLELCNLEFSVKQRQIINGISLKVETGEFIVITGPNGSGKSTLAKIIMGIEKPTSGKIIFDKQDITGMSVTDRAKLGIAYSFQQPLHFKGLTVKDLLQVAATGQETFLKDEKTDYKKLLATVGLGEEYLNREINNSLSGGELKRIEIASVLARNANLLVFDEPEAGIDIWSFTRLVKIFEKLRGNHTVIVISHQQRIIDIADRIIIIRDGKISQEELAS